MKANELLNVYFYALYDEADRQAYSGLTGNYCEAAVKSDIAANYTKPRYITVHRVPELVGVYDQTIGTVTIMPKEKNLQPGQIIACSSCAFFDKCDRKPTDGLDCCEDWQVKT